MNLVWLFVGGLGGFFVACLGMIAGIADDRARRVREQHALTAGGQCTRTHSKALGQTWIIAQSNYTTKTVERSW